jgi:vancomycin resistance protein YoaR
MQVKSSRRPVGRRPSSGRKDPKLGGGDGERRGGKRTVAGLVLTICAVIAVLVAADYWSNYGEIFRGVEVGTVYLGGKTPEEAERIIRERTTGILKEIRLDGPEEITLTARQIGADYYVEATVEAAYAVGREGSIVRRLSDRLRAAYGTITIPSDVDYRSESVRAQVEKIASRLDEEPREATVNLHSRGVEVVGSRDGYKLDVDATTQNVGRAVEDMRGEAEIAGEVLEPRYTTAEAEQAADKARAAMDEPLILTYKGERWTVSPADVGTTLDITAAKDGDFRVSLNRERLKAGLANVYSALTVEPVEADFVVNGTEVSVTPGESGRRIDEQKLLGAIESGLFEGKRAYEVPVVTTEPELTTAEAERLRPTQLIGRYRTRYVGTGDESRARVENLEIASNAINGATLAPGEVFSANDILAPLDYNDAKVIINGKVESALGGGLCQIASTVYMAVNYAGLDVIERHPHYSELSYIRPGLDATLWFGAANGYSGQELDMRFRNTTDAYVLLREYVADDGYIYAEVWGRPTGREVEMDSERTSASADHTKWVTYQTVKQDGKVLFDGVLHRDTYQPLMSEEGYAIPNATPASVNP